MEKVETKYGEEEPPVIDFSSEFSRLMKSGGVAKTNPPVSDGFPGEIERPRSKVMDKPSIVAGVRKKMQKIKFPFSFGIMVIQDYH